MENPICKKVISLLSGYIENKLDEKERLFVKEHLMNCQKCRDKYLEMKEITNNLRFEYEKLLNELEKEEENRFFRIREYETFKNNISAYIDNELDYDESIKIRKYLLKSKPARNELEKAYKLKNEIKNSFSTYQNRLNFNCSKKIINKLKSKKRSPGNYYMKAAAMLGIVIASVLILSAYLFVNYFNPASAQTPIDKSVKLADNVTRKYEEDDLIEVYFDENGEMLLLYK